MNHHHRIVQLESKELQKLTTRVGGRKLPNFGLGRHRRHKRIFELHRRSGRRPSWPRKRTLERVQCPSRPAERT